jgi:hypothetical protein
VPDRRRDRRFRLTEPASGAVRVFLDVVIQANGEDEWLAVSRQSVRTGELLMLDVVGDDDAAQRSKPISVCVIDSRPIILDGAVHHRLRLHGCDIGGLLFEQEIRRG